MIYTIFGFDFTFDLSLHQLLLFCASLGLYLRLLLSIISHQIWLKSYSQFLIFSLLPITGYLITSVISNNIALSLGMVGALSIVRFRTPVKNPSELVIYFVLITLGIVVNVSPNIALNFIIFVTFIVIATETYYFLVIKLNIKPLNYGNENYYYLTIVSKLRNESVEKLSELINFSTEESGETIYRFRSNDRDHLMAFEEKFPSKDIISLSVDAPTT